MVGDTNLNAIGRSHVKNCEVEASFGAGIADQTLEATTLFEVTTSRPEDGR